MPEAKQTKNWTALFEITWRIKQHALALNDKMFDIIITCVMALDERIKLKAPLNKFRSCCFWAHTFSTSIS